MFEGREKNFRHLIPHNTPFPHPPPPLLPPLQSQHADLAAASTAAVKTNFIWILFTPCSRSGTFYYTKRYMNTKSLLPEWSWVTCKVIRYEYVLPDMVFREGSWTAHLERFYLSVSVEKEGVIELACVRNSLHRLRNSSRNFILISRSCAGHIQDFVTRPTAPQAAFSWQHKNDW